MKTNPQIQKILIAVDETPYSEKAWQYGYHLAKQMKAKIALVHVNEIPAMPTYVGNLVVGEAPTIMPDLMSIQEENTQKLFKKISKSVIGIFYKKQTTPLRGKIFFGRTFCKAANPPKIKNYFFPKKLANFFEKI